jgi:hypothetical protein
LNLFKKVILLGVAIVALGTVLLYKNTTPNVNADSADFQEQVEKRNGPIEKAITLSEADLISLENLKAILSENSKSLSRIFLRVRSRVSFRCGPVGENCVIKTGSQSGADLTKYISLIENESIPLALIYDLDINDFKYRFDKFKDVVGAKYSPKQQEDHPESKVVFSNPVFKEKIYEDFKNKINLANFEKVIFGSELNLFFYNILGTKTRTKETQAFWSVLDQARKDHPKIQFSSAFNFEHLNYYNYWSTLGRDEVQSLDFMAFTSHPLHLGWAHFSKFEEQLYGFDGQRSATPEMNYYTTIRDNYWKRKDVYLVDFGYPVDESGEQNRGLILQHVIANQAIKCVSWQVTPLIKIQMPEAKYLNALSLWNENFVLSDSGKWFFSL